jgi:hypothetical protein
LTLCASFQSGSGHSPVVTDKIFLRRKRRIEVKLDSRLAAQVLAGIATLTHRDHVDKRTLSELVLKARCENSVKQWSSERRRSPAPEGEGSKLASCQAGIFIN